MFRKGKMCLISHFRIIGKLEEDAIPCNQHSPSFLKCLKAKAFEAPHETESLARGRRHAGARPLLYPTPRAKLPGSKAGVLRPTRRGVYSEDTFPQLWQVLHFHALLKGKYQSKTGTGKQVMSLKNYFSFRAECCPIYCDTNPLWTDASGMKLEQGNITQFFPPVTINLICKHDFLLLNLFNLYLPFPSHHPPLNIKFETFPSSLMSFSAICFI